MNEVAFRNTKGDREADLARYFQAQYADFDEDIAFYQQLAETAGGPILELGCGTGRVLLQLAKHGKTCVGVDSDTAMLRRLALQLSGDPTVKVHLIKARVESLPLTGNFPLIISPCSTMAYLPDPQFRAALSRIRSLLPPNGILAMDLPAAKQPRILETQQGEIIDEFHEPERGTDVQVSAAQRRLNETTYEVNWHYEEMTPDGHTQRTTIPTRYHLRTIEKLKDMLGEAGLRLEDGYRNYSLEPIQPDAPGFIAIARPDHG
ncbi:MAG: class I SAM-dependent methyltransferase [Anaerolineales bacterium]